MTAYNLVRFRVKPGHEKEFVDAHKAMDRSSMKGLRKATLIKTGDRTYAFVGEWNAMSDIAAARSIMIANLDKTRFLAAASHDVLQPLNAARLYVTSLVERQLGGAEATLVRNIDASMEAVEEILNVLIEISRLDAGRLEPDLTAFRLEEVFERLAVEFEPLAHEKGLDLRIVPSQALIDGKGRGHRLKATLELTVIPLCWPDRKGLTAGMGQ